MTPPIKPQVCLDGDRVAVYLGTSYKLLELASAKKMMRDMRRHVAILERRIKQAKRADK